MSIPPRTPATSGGKKSRARARAIPQELPEDHPDWRPVGADGKSRVPFARDVIPEERLAALFGMLSQGIALDVAARAPEVASTASEITRFRHREPAFDEAIADAMREGQLSYQDRLRGTVRARATSPTNGSDRLLEVELATHVPGYEHLRRDRMTVDGKVRHDFAIAFDPAQLDKLPIEKRRELLGILEALDGDVVIEGKARPARELTGGNG